MNRPFTLAPFEQGRLLRNETDPEVAGGICVALCNLWLQAVQARPADSPAQRMQLMAARFGAAKLHQKQYGQARRMMGREQARQSVGRPLGLDFDAQTTVMRIAVGQAGLLAKMVADLRAPGAAATWSMRFQAGGGHAIAGFNRLEPVTGNITRLHAHVFDPNVGEYAAALPDLPAVVADLFGRFPVYGTVVELHRAEVRPI